MKKLFLFLFVMPFVIIKAQAPAGNQTKEVKDSSATEKNVLSEKSKKEAQEKLEGYRKRIIAGENFAVLATLYSEDPGSAKLGGLYQNIKRGEFVPEFETAAFSLKPGEISQVFETMYGFHIVQLIERRGEFVDVRHILIIPK